MLSKKLSVVCILPVLFLLVGSTAVQVSNHRAQADIDQPYTFVPTPCTFIDTSDLLFLSTPADELGYKCGYVIVPERHAYPDGPTIRIPVAVLPAQGPVVKPDPLFMVQGGPGASAFDIFPFLVPNTPMAADRDIVMINQRGTQYADPELVCHETIEGITDLALLPMEEGLDVALEQIETCRQRLTSQGIDLSAYNSLENANDIEAIRQVLGYDEYNFYGVSYGTLLGLHLLRDHPQHLRSVVLDGVVPPQLSFIEEATQNKNRVFDELFRTCDQDPECASSYPNLEDRLENLVEELDVNPVTIHIKDKETGEVIDARLDGDALLGILFQSFYLDHPYAIFPRLVMDVESEDYLFIEQLWSLVAFDRSFSEGMYHSVICAEEVNIDPDQAPTGGERPYLNRSSREELQSYLDLCDIWQVEALPDHVNEAVQSDKPVLLLSGQYDPITPPHFAEMVDESLSNAHHIVDPYGSHGIAFDGACISQVIQDFLNNPTIQPDASCLNSPERREEFVPADAVTVPIMAPLAQFDPGALNLLGVASIILTVLLSTFLVWPIAWLVSLIRNRKPELSSEQRRLRLAGRILLLLFGLLALVFAISMTVFIITILFTSLSYLSVYALPARVRPFLYLPYILLLLAIGIWVSGVLLWRDREQALWEKVYYSLLGLCAAGYVLLLGLQGFIL